MGLTTGPGQPDRTELEELCCFLHFLAREGPAVPFFLPLTRPVPLQRPKKENSFQTPRPPPPCFPRVRVEARAHKVLRLSLRLFPPQAGEARAEGRRERGPARAARGVVVVVVGRNHFSSLLPGAAVIKRHREENSVLPLFSAFYSSLIAST